MSESNSNTFNNDHPTYSDVYSSIRGSLVFAGECMLELRNLNDAQLAKSFAGDIFNSSVYLKRAFPEILVEFMSCLGHDVLSNELVGRLSQERVGTKFLARSQQQHLGSYMVLTDDQGERSFLYWRNDSAAKHMLSTLSQDQLSELHNVGLFFFSGISIAILHDKDRELFWQQLERMKQSGVVIVFDPNYRPQLWPSVEFAKQQIEKAMQMADVLLPGVDDFEKLYGMNDFEQCVQFCLQFSPSELVMKHGEKNVHIINSKGRVVVPVVANRNVVDTTSAGDAFNGVYLGSRVSGRSPAESALAASSAASKVIETPGAIMPKPLFDEFWQDYCCAQR